ncbi:hypothetical protein BDZ91DRAFT_808962 [Kalaharituber pfeilii]|nr:hypothetical protein BDZ91DRAFT_808962 [Kalaharituber pfeilii]
MPRRPYTRYPCGIYGPRHLVRRCAREAKNKKLGLPAPSKPDIPRPGQERLHSFYAPALEAGVYTVTVTQDLKAPTGHSLTLPEAEAPQSKQQFEVVAPRFKLPDDAIHSSFPPQGYGALSNTLPHVVLTDPHLAWDRIASAEPGRQSPDWNRNQVPWLALLVFTQDELKLTADQLNGADGLFTNTSLAGTKIQQTQTFTINMKVSDVPKIKSTISPIAALKSEPSDHKTTDVIFVPSKLFAELVTSYNEDGDPIKQKGPDVSRYKYLAHARDINTTGMAEAGVEDHGVFGIIISHRTGPLSNTQPQPVTAHLVSIEGVESDGMNNQWPIEFKNIDYVVMSSLYSWNFVTLPEKSFNIETTLANLGRTLNVLRAPDSVLNSLNPSSLSATDSMNLRLRGRLQDGYTLTKYRTATGEITAAITRGPLTPTLVPYPLVPSDRASKGLTWLSNTGIDLQIMDPQIGIMDITYSAAWQLGKALAVADQVFTTALGKLRKVLYDGTMNEAKVAILKELKAYKSRGETILSLTKTIPKLNSMHKHGGLHSPTGGMQDRWRRPQPKHPDLSYKSPQIQRIFHEHSAKVGRQLMSSSNGDGSELYDEHNMPSSIDWMIVLHWVLDKMFLYNIPAHYLIVDPTYLPKESLRFFHIDRNWIDALIDGALSLGNHLDGEDLVRMRLHEMIHTYLNPKSKPQVPIYGFLLHSDAVTQYPDLKVSVDIKLDHKREQTPILRHDNLDVKKGVMLCLLDQLPGNPGMDSITFTQPPHQQSFIAGAELDSHHIKTLYKKIFTLGHVEDPNANGWGEHQWERPDDPNPPTTPPPISKDDGIKHPKMVFKWGNEIVPEVRTLLFPAWAQDITTVLNHYGAQYNPPWYNDPIPNSAMSGIQLNNPIYQLIIQYGAIPSPPSRSSAEKDKRTVVPFRSTLESTASPHPLMLASGGMKTAAYSWSRIQPRSKPRNASNTSAPSPPTSLSQHRPAIPSPPATALPAGAPQYDYSCYPVDNDQKNPGIPVGTGIPKDLVFSIIQKSGTGGGTYQLKSLTLVLELATGDCSDPRWRTCLLSEYNGPGPTMLSNLRLNVLAQVEDDPVHGRCLALRLLPRSTKRYVTPHMSTEMSFVLPVCRILNHDIRERIPVWITAEYDGFEPVPDENYHVISFQQR